MKQLSTQNIIIEVSREELENLSAFANSSYLRYYDLWKKTKEDYYRGMMIRADRIWNQIYLIQKSLPF